MCGHPLRRGRWCGGTADRQWRSKMTATLKMTHRAIGVEVRRGTYDIVVDGQRAGSLEMNDTIEIPVTPCKFAVAETPAELRPSRPPRARPSPSDAPERAFCRSFSCPSSFQAWRSNSAVKPMIGPCDDIVAGRDQPGNKRRTDATKPGYQPTRRLSPWAYRRPVYAALRALLPMSAWPCERRTLPLRQALRILRE